MSLPDFFFDRITADIRQQMDGVLALTGQLARQPMAPDAATCLAGVADAAAGVRRMLDSATDLKSVATHGLALRPAPLVLRDLMDDIQARWQARGASAGVTVLVSYDGPPDACVLMDRSRLLQIFDGFIAEAATSADSGAVESSLRVAPSGRDLRLEGRIRGGGRGVWRDRGLETRVRDVAERFGLEVALGVMLARGVVSGLSGAVRHEANAGGAETMAFELTAPVAPEAASEPARTGRPGHVLVVDDNATNRTVAQALCEMFNCTSEAAADGLEAIRVAGSGRFDLILMDIRMPGMDGVAAARAIRRLPGRAGRTPIVALTANADPEDVEHYLAAGMDGVVEKPMKPEHLFAELSRVLDLPEDAAVA